MLIFEDCANSALPARFLPLPRRFFLRQNGAGCFRRHVSYAPKGRCDMRRRLRRSAGHIFSAPEWRVVPPAAHFVCAGGALRFAAPSPPLRGPYLFCLGRKDMEEKTAGMRNRAVAPDKTIRSILRLVVTPSVVRTPFGRAAEFLLSKILLRQIFVPAKSKSICPESMRCFQVSPVSASQPLLVVEEKRAK